MAESSAYMFSNTLQSDYIDGDGNIVHHWWSNGWITEVLTGPDGVTEVKERADALCGVTRS